MRPRYSIAKFTMELATVAGVILIVIAILGTIIHHHINGSSFIDYLIAGVMIINGIAIIAASQMGNALLDTAISTRETADSMIALIASMKRSETMIDPANDKNKPIRAQR